MSEVLKAFKARADTAGILLDFDGTLSEIVDRPSEARPLPGVRECLAHLADRYRTVAIVSGRSAHELVEWLGPDLDIWGVHGAEHSRAHEVNVRLSPTAGEFAERMTSVLRDAQDRVRELGIAGAVVEDKAVMVVLHYRAAADPARAAETLDGLADELAEKYGLWQASGRMAFELRPPVRLSKGDVVEALAREAQLGAVLFAGDDTVDLPAFDALDRLERTGLLAVRVGVSSPEAPPELVDRADIVVDGPSEMLGLLQSLL
jgi:trehalose 6-phosphate phosphatase